MYSQYSTTSETKASVCIVLSLGVAVEKDKKEEFIAPARWVHSSALTPTERGFKDSLLNLSITN